MLTLAKAHFSIKEMNRYKTSLVQTKGLHYDIISLSLIVEQVLVVDSEHGKIIVCISFQLV